MGQWFRKTVIDPSRGEPYPWYHRQYQRVPTIDECYVDDIVCREEANLQFKRDWLVEQEILSLLRERMRIACFMRREQESLTCRSSPSLSLTLPLGQTMCASPLLTLMKELLKIISSSMVRSATSMGELSRP